MSSKFSTQRRRARTALVGALLVSGLTVGSAAQAAITFQFNFLDSAGTGFNDATTGNARQAALTEAASMYSTLFGQYFTNSGTIVLDATATNNPLSSNLASAGSEVVLFGSTPSGFNLDEVVRTKLQTGFDANGASADGSVDVNFGRPWQLDAGATVTNGQYDFYSTVFHEFTHALGFSSLISQNGTGLFNTKHWAVYDQFLVDKNGNPVIDHTTFAIDSAIWNTASVGGTSPDAGIFFNGANAVAANGGELVGLYSPTTWSDGSSVSHIDTDNPAYDGMMMLHARGTGPDARNFSSIEVGMLQDLGYTPVSVVPEPESFALMLAGLGVLGLVRRRRNV